MFPRLINRLHLEQVEESYSQHARFGLWAALVLFVLAVLSLIHAVFPFLFSRWPDRLYQYFQTASHERMTRVNEILKRKNLET